MLKGSLVLVKKNWIRTRRNYFQSLIQKLERSQGEFTKTVHSLS